MDDARGARADGTAQYFRDLARSSLPLDAAAEARLATVLRDAHVAVWRELLSHAPLAPRLLELALHVWPRDVDLRALRRGTADVAVAARSLARRDHDRTLADALVAEAERLCFASGSAADRRFLRRVHEARRRAERARHEFTRRNLRLVVVIARRYVGLGLSLPDLIQEGNLGLLKAIDRFDVDRGLRFSTYATWWVRQTILRSLRESGNLVRLPAHIAAARDRLRRVRRQLTGELGRAPTVEELRLATGLSMLRIETALQEQERSSLDAPPEADGDRPLHELLADPRADELAAPRLLADDETRRELAAAIERLAPIEAAVLRGRFGVDDGDEESRTLADIGRERGLSRERIRQIQERAIVKMRRFLRQAEGRPRGRAPAPITSGSSRRGRAPR